MLSQLCSFSVKSELDLRMTVNVCVMNLPNCAEISQDMLSFAVASGKLERLGRVHSDPVDFKSQSSLVVFEC